MAFSIKGYRDLLVTYLKPQWRQAIFLLVLLLAGIGLELVNPQILRSFIDTAMAGGALQILTGIALLFLVVALATQIVSVAETYLAENLGWIATNRLRADLTLHCLRLDPSFHNAHTPGELIERVDGDVAKLGNFFSRFVVQLLGNVLLLIGVLIVSFGIDWRVGLGLTGFAVVSIVMLYRLRNVAVPYWVASREANADLFGFLEERLSGTEDIRSSGATAYVLRRLYERLRTVLHTDRRAAVIGTVTWGTTIILLALGTAIALSLATYLFRAGEITLGTVFLIFAYAELLRRPIEQISRQIEDLQQATAGITRIQELLATKSAISEGGTADLPTGALAVEFDHVSFGYDQRPTTNDERGRTNDQRPPTHCVGAECDEHSSWPALLAGLDASTHLAVRRTDQGVSAEHLATQGVPGTQCANVVLHDLSFMVPAGTTLGLIGRTGSGKTTVTRLLFRLYDPSQGAIRLGGIDLRNARLADVRQRIGMVTQDIQLFHATVRDNLTFFDSHVSNERIVQVLYELGLERWYHRLPDGLNTKLAPDGNGLSAGEAQLLSFARVFLQDPDLVILDEASSRLDPATEQLIERAIDRLLRGVPAGPGTRRTAIVIAHRLHTVQRADMILILEDGRIREYGARDRLMRDPDSHFYRLLQTGLEETLG